MTELQIAGKFRLPVKADRFETISCGNINRTYRIFAGEDSYILQRINTNVFRDPVALMNNITAVCAHLKAKIAAEGGDPEREAMTFLPADDGSYLYRDEEGFFWRMYRFIEAKSYQSIEKPGLFYNAAKAFGKFQCQLSDFPAEKLAETIPNFHNTVSRLADFEAAVKGAEKDRPERLEKVRDMVDYLLSRRALAHCAVDAMAKGEIPVRVTHNDTKLNNILMDSETDEGLCVIDLDTVMPGSVLYDFGDAIRFGANTASEDEEDVSKVSLSLDLYAEFARGFLDGTGGALNAREIELLPDGAMLLTYEQAMRFLGDYLNGDTYFKINYPEHNYVRSRVQVALLQDMEAKKAEMQKVLG